MLSKFTTQSLIERDKGWGPSTGFDAELKSVFGVDLDAAECRAYGDPAGLVTIDKTLLADLLPTLEAHSIWTAEKLEGLAVTAAGDVFAVTDDDGVDDATGETVFLRLGPWSEALAVDRHRALGLTHSRPVPSQRVRRSRVENLREWWTNPDTTHSDRKPDIERDELSAVNDRP